MELFTNSLLTKPHTLSSSFLTTPSLTALTKKTRFKTHLKSSKSPPISARFGRPTKRRNSLRKKLNDSKVSPNDIDPTHHFVHNHAYDANLVDNSSNINMGSEKVENFENDGGEKLGDSMMWNKLESWVELYKKDVEFWGIGSNPIFTVFQDCDGKVDKVVVDEDEIVRRGGVDPLFYREGGEREVFSEVNSKISRAKDLAREVESGRDVIARNSSVAKFVVVGEESGFVSRIRGVNVPKDLMPKVSRIGGAVVCGLIVVWGVKKLWSLGGRGAEVTEFEKEMLRRKIKARVEKEKLRKGGVEVVEKVAELPSVITKRPELDKGEVLSSIRKAKGLSSDLAIVDVGGANETVSEEMDFRIKEIQMMARHARKIEKGEYSASEKDVSDNETSTELSMVEENSKEAVDLIGGDDLLIQASAVLPELEKIAAEELPEGHMNAMNNLSSIYSTETRVVNGNSETEIVGHHESKITDANFTSVEASEGIEDVELLSVPNGRITDDKNSHIHDLSHSHDSSISSDLTEKVQFSDVSSSQLSPPKKTPVRRMPKIIRSVKEAREYLSHKQDQKPDVNESSVDVTLANEGMNHHFSQGLREDNKALDSSGEYRILDRGPATEIDISEDYAVNDNEYCATDINGLNKEPQIGVMHNSTPDLESAENSRFDTKLKLGNSRKSDEALKHSNLGQRSDFVPGENPLHEGGLEANEHLLSDESLDIVDKLDDLPKATNLSEMLDIFPGGIASLNAGNSSKASDIHDENAMIDANLDVKSFLPNEKDLTKVDALNGTRKPTKSSEISDPVAVENNLADLGSENAFLPSELNREGIKEGGSFAAKENWLEKNFHEVEPIVNKIGSGIRNNYVVAREKVKQESGAGLDFMNLRSINEDTELEWMKDDKLRDIVFKVRDNELAGRDPFHSMSVEDKDTFFKGLESKVEKENQKLSVLHEWLHTNIENLDYGADGISIYDPPEKIMPRWKGPPIDEIPDFLSNAEEQQQVVSLQKANESTQRDNTGIPQEAAITKSRPKEKAAKVSKTVIEASDGSIKPGKKSGKEYWQHTKKWSRGFVESYNAENDPEVKSTMKDIGKDLDRWITEKEIQDAADLMDKIPQRGKDFIEKKLNKLKREMEMFGPQAVVSKYREYADEKEEDYMWWLDLPHVLCIELYTYEGEDEEVGFYTLEMAPDLELEPKPQHVIAFQDPGDCKNFCYIIQAHLEMLGKGRAFIVPQPPKDVFRQAKANGFGVTVIRKGEVQLNVDQPLEEVEELITEIGSKMYHDKIMRERSVDINSLMKGVFGFNRPVKRKRKKRARKRPSKP